jgi:putative PIN family toxin of toxin-antitoxin system
VHVAGGGSETNAPGSHAVANATSFPAMSARIIQPSVDMLCDRPKFRLSTDEQHELLADYVPYCTTVRMPARPPSTPPCRDPADAVFLQLAIAGNADHLVTGDQDLLSLAPAFRRSIIVPWALLANA